MKSPTIVKDIKINRLCRCTWKIYVKIDGQVPFLLQGTKEERTVWMGSESGTSLSMPQGELGETP